MLPHQERVVAEALELSDKITKLSAFMTTPNFKSLIFDEQERLWRQLSHMTSYNNVLDERIAAFK